ncbi:MAG: DUF4124 domain-containing protein, partial [Geobacteraceae bacterium]
YQFQIKDAVKAARIEATKAYNQYVEEPKTSQRRGRFDLELVLLVSIALLAFTTSVHAETYKWIDDKGTINFTEDLGNVPPKYRKTVRIVGVEEESGSAETAGNADKGGPEKDSAAAEPKGKVKEVAPSGKQENKKTLYGDKDAETWRREYGIVKSDLRGVEEQLVANRKMLQDTTKMSRGEYLGITNTNKALESRILDLREKLNALKQSATSAGVPTDLLE